MRAVPLTILCAASLVARDPLAQRIRHTDPSRYRPSPSVHGGAGTMAFTGLLNASNFQSNLLFLHRGVLPPKTGINSPRSTPTAGNPPRLASVPATPPTMRW